MGKRERDRAARQAAATGRKGWLAVTVLVALLLAAVAIPRLVSDAAPGVVAASAGAESPPARPLIRLRARVVATYRHDPSAYTQGLLWHDGLLYESTGTYGRSSLRRYDLERGEVTLQQDLPDDYFGEGLARIGDQLIQLTWQQGVALVYRLSDLVEEERRTYVGEGWGLCYNGESLIMSDGTHILSLRDPESFDEVGRLTVTRDGGPLDRLNELEWAEGRIYANVYQTEEIVRIDPHSGRVEATIDASGLLSPQEQRRAEVLNGIAYRPSDGAFFLTGKNWPRLFQVEFVPRS